MKEDVIAKIVISESSEGGGPGKPPILVAPTLTLNMPVVPTALSFNVAVLVYKMNFSKPQQLKLVIVDPEKPDKNIFALAGNLPPMEQTVGTMVFNFGIHNAVFNNVGKHKAIVYLNDEEIVSDFFWTTNIGSENDEQYNN
jgi:hypothetical protein